MRAILIISSIVLSLVLLNGPAAAKSNDHICFHTLDANHDGKVTHKEFSQYYSADPQKFIAIDTNKDGILTHEEYHAMLGHGAE